MKRIWPYLYVALFVLSFLGGTDLFGKHDENTNADWIFVTASFVVCFIFPSMAISYACHRKANRIPRASFFRGFGGGWWTDPLQSLLVMTLWLFGWFLGSLVTLPHASSQGIMIVWWKGAMVLGLVLGGRLAHKKYRDSIV